MKILQEPKYCPVNKQWIGWRIDYSRRRGSKKFPRFSRGPFGDWGWQRKYDDSGVHHRPMAYRGFFKGFIEAYNDAYKWSYVSYQAESE